MAHPPCKTCDPEGLKILPTLYAALPPSVKTGLPASLSGQRVTDIPLSDGNHYGLRILREGYLYLIYAKGPNGRNYAEAYRVIANGTVRPLPLPAPLIELPEPGCERHGHSHDIRASTITIRKPSQCGEVFIAFSEHLWSDDTLAFYLAHEDKRRERMQSFFPAQWIDGAAYEHAVQATQADIEQIVEYMPGYDVSLLPPGKPYPPMLLALWDGIGITHELAGFRNDAASMLVVYAKQRALEIDAMQNIEAAHKAVVANAENQANRQEAMSRQAYRHAELGQSPEQAVAALQAQRAKDLAAASPARQAQIDAYYDDLEWMKRHRTPHYIQNSVNTLAYNTSARSPNASVNYTDYPPIAQQMAQAHALAQQDPASVHQRNVDERVTLDWPRYQEKLAAGQPAAFAKKFHAFEDAVAQLQGERTADLKAWLKSPLLLATLQDYHEHVIADGIAFVAVITEVVSGLSAQAQGQAVLDELLGLIDPTDPQSLLWRAFAYNQQDAKAALKQTLAQATAHKNTPMDDAHDGLQSVSQALMPLGSFVKLVDRIGSVEKHQQPVSFTERLVKSQNLDRLVVDMGRSLFKWTGSGELADCAGAMTIRGALMLRMGLSMQDTLGLLKLSAAAEPALRQALHANYRELRTQNVPAGEAYSRALAELAGNERGRLYRERWAEIMDRGDATAERLRMGVRIGGTLAVLQLLSFGALLSKSDKSGEDYALLVATGASAISACLIASAKVVTDFAENGAATLMRLKAVTGYLGGTAAIIGAVLDFEKARNNFGKNKTLFSLYFTKGLFGLAGGTAYFLTALSESAPLIARLAGGQVTWIGKLRAGIEAASAHSSKLAEMAVGAEGRKEAAAKAANLAMDAAAREAGVVLGARGGLLLIGRAVLFLAGWEVFAAVTAIQVLIWVFSDDDLQTWCEECAFGTEPKSWSAARQQEAFEKALVSVGLEQEAVT
ncbi:MAG: T6SS effector BTH_I2691 family protein [Acidihalobacter sp.]